MITALWIGAALAAGILIELSEIAKTLGSIRDLLVDLSGHASGIESACGMLVSDSNKARAARERDSRS
jgi:hypothetical protein